MLDPRDTEAAWHTALQRTELDLIELGDAPKRQLVFENVSFPELRAFRVAAADQCRASQ